MTVNWTSLGDSGILALGDSPYYMVLGRGSSVLEQVPAVLYDVSQGISALPPVRHAPISFAVPILPFRFLILVIQNLPYISLIVNTDAEWYTGLDPSNIGNHQIDMVSAK